MLRVERTRELPVFGIPSPSILLLLVPSLRERTRLSSTIRRLRNNNNNNNFFFFFLFFWVFVSHSSERERPERNGGFKGNEEMMGNNWILKFGRVRCVQLSLSWSWFQIGEGFPDRQEMRRAGNPNWKPDRFFFLFLFKLLLLFSLVV